MHTPDYNELLEAVLPLVVSEGVDVISYAEGFVRCPGHELHTTHSRPCDCKLYVNVWQGKLVPRIYCFHETCRDRVEVVNQRLCRAALEGRAQISPVAATQFAEPWTSQTVTADFAELSDDLRYTLPHQK